MANTPRAGLCNKLFPWARAKLFSKLNNIPMLQTFWGQWKLGTFLRREADKRLYFDLFHSNPEEINGLRAMSIRFSFPRYSEPRELKLQSNFQSKGVICFSGCAPYFRNLMGHREYIKRELLKIVREKWISKTEKIGKLPLVGMHVRRGDYAIAGSVADFKTKSNYLQTPIDWFIDNLIEIRKLFGKSIDAFVVTDGTENDVLPILQLGGVQLIRTGSSIGDLLVLSRAKALLASGGSTFGAWATYLGGMPTIAIHGRSFSQFDLDFGDSCFVGECDSGRIPNQFCSHFFKNINAEPR